MSRTASSLSSSLSTLARSRVPTTRDVVPGARVNIVLKVDQPTGRTVSGTVKDVLTRGDHHRGIKVRLVDGRIGRVQTMAAIGGSGVPSSSFGPQQDQQNEGVGDAAEAGEGPFPPPAGAPETSFISGGRRGGGRHRGPRREEQQEPPAHQIGLDAYVKQKKPKGKGGRSRAAAEEDDTALNVSPTDDPGQSETVACPVCGSFTGDEAAVAHHVAGHFD